MGELVQTSFCQCFCRRQAQLPPGEVGLGLRNGAVPWRGRSASPDVRRGVRAASSRNQVQRDPQRACWCGVVSALHLGGRRSGQLPCRPHGGSHAAVPTALRHAAAAGPGGAPHRQRRREPPGVRVARLRERPERVRGRQRLPARRAPMVEEAHGPRGPRRVVPERHLVPRGAPLQPHDVREPRGLRAERRRGQLARPREARLRRRGELQPHRRLRPRGLQRHGLRGPHGALQPPPAPDRSAHDEREQRGLEHGRPGLSGRGGRGAAARGRALAPRPLLGPAPAPPREPALRA
mmetsp:Transcript_21992/g.51650  ORF Transcript_21992/g.51650 Transcript_21992/m.51650 type:complete len:293 (+) Transcript_21992:765-1643(+)